MSFNYSAPFVSAELRDVRPGQLEMRAPVLNGAVQIETINPNVVKTPLRVQCHESGNIDISMLDEGPLQFEIISSNFDSGQMVDEHLPVFAQPVDKVSFQRLSPPNKQQLWLAAGENLVITKPERLEQLAFTVARYAVHKQRANFLEARRAARAAN